MKSECQRIDAFELWCWRRLLRVPWTAGRFNQSILKEISPGVHWKVFIGRTNAEVFIGRTDVLWKDWVFFQRRTVHWKDWCWSWNSNTLATSCEELTHWKRPWCLEGLGEGGEGDDRGWDGWMASLTRWTWDWVNSGSWWWTGRPGVLWFMGLQRVGHYWATELNWTD